MAEEPPEFRLLGLSTVEVDAAQRDDKLVRGTIAGDAESLRSLMAHYDRLIRYTVFHGFRSQCRRDPSFLDARSSEVWFGFVETVRKQGIIPGGSVKGLLIRIARNKCIDYLRHSKSMEAISTAGEDIEAGQNMAARDDDPLQTLEAYERFAALQSCIQEITGSDANLYRERELLLESRWSDVSRRLNIPESTLRSRWHRLLETLRRCVEKKMGKESETFAPKADPSDPMNE